MINKDIEARVEERVKEELTPVDVEREYEIMLDEVYGDVNVCGLTYSAGYALKELDPTAFRCGMSDWESEEFEEIDGEYYKREEVKNIREEVEAEEGEQDEM